MKKMLIGSIVGGIIIFLWQFLSFAAINFHKAQQDYTPKQDAIMSFLNSQNLQPGGYALPALPPGSTMEQYDAAMKAAQGKPWAMIQYHSSMENNMVMNMIRGLIGNMVMVFLFCWLLGKLKTPSFNSILACALVTGLIVYINAPYTNHIWYQTFDVRAHLLDAIVSWGLAGAWLGWWMRRGTRTVSTTGIAEPQLETTA